MKGENVSDDACGDLSFVICGLNLPDDRLDDPTVFEPSELGFVAPEIAELVDFFLRRGFFLGVGVSGRRVGGRKSWTVIDESECVLDVEDEADGDGGRSAGLDRGEVAKLGG